MDGSPTPHGALVVSLDFELHWGVRDKLTIAQYRDNLLGVRQSVPALLRLFAGERIHATWATVGMLLCDGRRDLLDNLPVRRPAYARPGLSPYATVADVGESERDDPFHFAPSLVRRIADTPGQEIGTHTFSHYYCLEAGQREDEFRDDLRAAIGLTRARVGRSVESIVFPRNQASTPHLAVCGELGLVAFRGNLDDWAYRPRRDDAESLVRRGVRLADAYLPLTGGNARPVPAGAVCAPVNVCASRYLRPYAPKLRALEPLRLRRIRRDLHYAATRGEVYHLWWHPHDFGVHLDENLAVLERILGCFARLRDTHGMESLTMAEAARRALRREQPAGVPFERRGASVA